MEPRIAFRYRITCAVSAVCLEQRAFTDSPSLNQLANTLFVDANWTQMGYPYEFLIKSGAEEMGIECMHMLGCSDCSMAVPWSVGSQTELNATATAQMLVD